MYVGETGRSVRTRKREHANAVKTFNTKKSALSQHVMDSIGVANYFFFAPTPESVM